MNGIATVAGTVAGSSLGASQAGYLLTVEPTAEVLVLLAAVALLVGGVVGSVTPVVPGGILSLAGVLLYWWHTDYSEPGLVLLTALVLVAVTATAVDWLAGVVSAKASGASTGTALLAGAVGFVLLFLTGPLGMLLGVVGTVFGVEYYRHRDARRGIRAALITAVGLLGSSVAQVLLTGTVLVAMLVVILL